MMVKSECNVAPEAFESFSISLELMVLKRLVFLEDALDAMPDWDTAFSQIKRVHADIFYDERIDALLARWESFLVTSTGAGVEQIVTLTYLDHQFSKSNAHALAKFWCDNVGLFFFGEAADAFIENSRFTFKELSKATDEVLNKLRRERLLILNSHPEYIARKVEPEIPTSADPDDGGLSMKQFAKKLGLSTETVRVYANRAGLKPGRRGKPRVFTADEIRSICNCILQKQTATEHTRSAAANLIESLPKPK